MKPTLSLPITPAASPRKIPRNVPRSSEPGSEAAVRPKFNRDHAAVDALRKRIVALVLEDVWSIKGIAWECKCGISYVHGMIKRAGFIPMQVTREERDLVLARRKSISAGPSQVAVELKHQPQPIGAGRRDTIKEGGK